MRRAILTLAISLLIGGLSACGGKTDDAQTQDQEVYDAEVVEAVYYCPMKCEDEKTYAEAGTCPECGMDLVILEVEE